MAPVYSKLVEIFPEQLSITWGDSNNTLATVTNEQPDIIFVDGGHFQHVAEIDIRLSLEILRPGGFIVVDDWDYPHIPTAAYVTIPKSQWFTHGPPGPGQVAYYQKR